jgi:hypothetical protein
MGRLVMDWTRCGSERPPMGRDVIVAHVVGNGEEYDIFIAKAFRRLSDGFDWILPTHKTVLAKEGDLWCLVKNPKDHKVTSVDFKEGGQ